MDNVTYSLTKKIAASALSGVQSMSVSGQTLTINTKDSGVLTMTFPKPRDGVSVTDIDVNANNQIVFTMSDGTEFISGKIPTVKGADGFSPTITENADNTDKIYKLDITTADSTFTTPNLKGADGTGGTGGSGEENKINSISVNGVNVEIDQNKNVDITVPEAYDDTAIRTEIAKKADTDHTHTTVNGHTVESDVPVDAKFTDTVYDDTQVKTQIQAVANGLMDSVGYSADYKTIDIIAKNGVKKSVNVAPIISHASITELSDVDTTNKATGKALVYNATTSKHEYADVSGTDEKVKMDSSTDAKYLSELLDNVTIANENGELKVKKLDGQEVTITEINYLKGLTMNVMDLVNMFSNGGVKIINTPVATYAELLVIDKSSFIEGISYLVYVLADENHDNAKTTYLVDKDSETPTYFGFADSQRDFTTNPIDLATEITGKLGIANMDSDAIKALFTVDDTYKTETVTNNAFSTHGAKALYDELLLAIGNKANDSDLTAHKDDTDIHVSTTEKDNWNGKANTSDLTAHTGDSVIHVTAENKTLWNTVSNKVNKEDGKALLADTDKTNYDDAVTKAHTHENKEVLDSITSDKVTAWDNKSEFSGNYLDLNNKPTIPKGDGTTITMDEDGTLHGQSVDIATTEKAGIVKPDGDTIEVSTDATISVSSKALTFSDHDTATSGTYFTDAEDGNMIVTDWTKNLLNPTLETTTNNGVTCTNNGDGTYTLNGKVIDRRTIIFNIGTYTLEKNKTYKFIGMPDLGLDLKCYVDARTDDNAQIQNIGIGENIYTSKNGQTGKLMRIIIDGEDYSDIVLNNVIIKPMITTDLNATYDDFVPYGGYDIKTCGKNLMSVNDATNGATLDAQDRFNIRIRGLDKGNIVSDRIYLLENGVMKGHQSFTFEVTIDEPYGIAIKHNGSTKDIDIEYINYMVRKGTYTLSFDVASNNPSVEGGLLLHNIQLEHGDTETDFEPYQDGGTVHIDSTTDFPLLGLKSFDGITNIISPANVKCVYPTNESGKVITNAINGKQDVLLDTVSGVKAKFTLENGIICVREI